MTYSVKIKGLNTTIMSRCQLIGGGLAAGVPPIAGVGHCRMEAATLLTYKKRTVNPVRQSLVIDMLGLLKF